VHHKVHHSSHSQAQELSLQFRIDNISYQRICFNIHLFHVWNYINDWLRIYALRSLASHKIDPYNPNCSKMSFIYFVGGNWDLSLWVIVISISRDPEVASKVWFPSFARLLVRTNPANWSIYSENIMSFISLLWLISVRWQHAHKHTITIAFRPLMRVVN
jgi:hypothetical protein